MKQVWPYLRVLLHSYSEIFFLQSTLIGGLLLAITLVNPHVGVSGLLSVISAYAFARLINVETTFLASGFYTYNALLVGLSIGYLFAQFSKNIAAKVAVTEIDPFRRQVARECGLTVWDPNEVNIEEKITEFTYGRKADIVIEATGNALWQALKCVTPGGKVIVIDPFILKKPKTPAEMRSSRRGRRSSPST